MTVAIRPLAQGELRIYLEIVGRAIRGLADSHYAREAIDAWVPEVSDRAVHQLAMNEDEEIRLIAELDGMPVGVGALVVGKSELRACYVVPEASRRGCGSAIVAEIERLARSHGVNHLQLAGSLKSGGFYTSLGYRVRERGDVALRNGYRLPCIWMEKDLCP